MKGEANFPIYPDNGCPEATEYLGKQSHCLDCPFYPRPCIQEGRQTRNRLRNEIIVQKAREGATVRALAGEFGISISTIQRILRDQERGRDYERKEML